MGWRRGDRGWATGGEGDGVGGEAWQGVTRRQGGEGGDGAGGPGGVGRGGWAASRREKRGEKMQVAFS